MGSDGTVYVVDMAGDPLAIDARATCAGACIGVTPVGARHRPDGAITSSMLGLSAIAADGTVRRYTRLRRKGGALPPGQLSASMARFTCRSTAQAVNSRR